MDASSTFLPGFLLAISGILLTLAPFAALACFVFAGLRLRSEGGTNYDAGGGVLKWFFWGAIMLSVPAVFSGTMPGLFGSGNGFPVPINGGGSDAAWNSGATYLQTGVESFINNILVARIVPLIAAALCFKALLDSAEGDSPLASVVSALVVLGAQGLCSLAQTSWNSASSGATVPFGAADILDGAVTYLANQVSPLIGVLCVIGAVLNFYRSKGWGQLLFTGVAFMSFTGLWNLVTKFVWGSSSGSHAW
jgi:hypothetical protein